MEERKKSILFVDDEQRILDGLRRMLYSFRKHWNMSFASGGKEALEMMENQHFDVIVSDMRMPEINGAQLLNTVKERYPDVIRFILSGYSDKEMIMQTLNAADQFLTKPCDAELLKDTILKAFEARERVGKQNLLAMVSEMKSLPTLPDLYVRLMDLLELPNSSLKDISAIVSQEMTVTAKVLQLVNSAFFGLRSHIQNIQQALAYLGLETLKAVILTTDVFAQFSRKEIERFDITKLYNHSIMVSAVARKIAETVRKEATFIDQCGMAGMLHDIGKVILIRNKPEEYANVLKQRHQNNTPSYQLENKLFDVNHATLGGYLMNLWGLPSKITDAISFHHDPRKSLSIDFNVTDVVYVSNILVGQMSKSNKYSVPSDLDVNYLHELDVEQHITQWADYCKKLKTSCGV